MATTRTIRFKCCLPQPEDPEAEPNVFASNGKTWKYEFQDQVDTDPINTNYTCDEDETAEICPVSTAIVKKITTV